MVSLWAEHWILTSPPNGVKIFLVKMSPQNSRAKDFLSFQSASHAIEALPSTSGGCCVPNETIKRWIDYHTVTVEFGLATNLCLVTSSGTTKPQAKDSLPSRTQRSPFFIVLSLCFYPRPIGFPWAAREPRSGGKRKTSGYLELKSHFHADPGVMIWFGLVDIFANTQINMIGSFHW